MSREPPMAQTKTAHELVPPTRVLDGFGNFIAPPSSARPVPTDFTGGATADHPPGFYGPPDALFAVNTLAPADRLTPLDFSPLTNARFEIYRTSEPLDLRGPILLAALALFLLDTHRGAIPRRRHPAADTALVSLCGRFNSLICGSGAFRKPCPRRRYPGRQRAAVGAGDQACLCRHRQCRRR